MSPTVSHRNDIIARPRFDILYALIAFEVTLGAFLLFQVQPLVAKVLLPRFGGAAAVWVTCAVFFQCALYLGYLAVERISTRISPRHQVLLFGAVLSVAALFFPLSDLLQQSADYTLDPAAQIIAALTYGLGLPFIALSMTSSLCQYWLYRFRGREPYHLYALSNGASFLALLSYPFFVEPNFDLVTQMSQWQALLWIMVFSAAGIYLSIGRWKEEAHVRESVRSLEIPARGDNLFWLAASAFGVILLLSVTHHLSADLAPVPLLWVLPLALYLGTFTVAFSARATDYLKGALPLYLLLLFAFLGAAYARHLLGALVLLLGVMTVGCLVCHVELARARPPGHHTPRFYRQVALGGALGGLFTGVAAPLLFTHQFELILALAAPTLLHRWSRDRIQGRSTALPLPLVLLFALGLSLLAYDRFQSGGQDSSNLVTRNFYGVLKVTENTAEVPPARQFSHGSTIHGLQRLDTPHELEPTSYYGPTSGIGRVLRSFSEDPIAVGVIGLGIGTVATYARADDTYTFFELNPSVHRIALEHFSFLSQGRGTIDVRIGDGRIELERWDGAPFDVIFIDAFSGDAIPTHLLTEEALATYRAKLKPHGAIVFHISNLYLELAPVLATLTEKAGMEGALIEDSGAPAELRSASLHYILTSNHALFLKPEIKPFIRAVPERTRLWTDRYSSLWTVFNLPH